MGLRLAHRRGWSAPGSDENGSAEHTATQAAPDGAAPSAPGPAHVPVDSARRTGSTDSPSNEPDEHPGDAIAASPAADSEKGGTA